MTGHDDKTGDSMAGGRAGTDGRLDPDPTPECRQGDRDDESLLARLLGPEWRWLPYPREAVVVLLHPCGLWVELAGSAQEWWSEGVSRSVAAALTASVEAGATGRHEGIVTRIDGDDQWSTVIRRVAP